MGKFKFITASLLFLFITSCTWKKDRLQVDVSKVNISPVKIDRYDKDLFEISLTDLKSGLISIQPRYLFFLGTDLNDTLKLSEMRSYLTNPRTKNFQEASEKKFPDLSTVESGLTSAFRHYKFYFPEATLPHVYTYISGGDYANPVLLVDSVMIVALDSYLGPDFKPYLSDGLALYKIHRMIPDAIVPDCIMSLANSLSPVNQLAGTLLDRMIDAGKRLYISDAFLPETPGYLKIGYDKDKFEWIEKNESHVWAAIIENSMLYSSNGQTIRTFFADGPNTPAFGKESPPRLGEYIGWRIIRSYMDKNRDYTLQDLINQKDSQQILMNSGYKPEKK